MKNPKKLFHQISYLQYPIMASSLIFYIPFVISLINQSPDWSHLNNMLILIGVGLSFSTLQDTTTTQNEFSRKIWQSPRKGKIFLILMAAFAFLLIMSGLISLFLTQDDMTNSVAVGITVLGIGYIGLLKSAIEMYENHRTDKNPELRTQTSSDAGQMTAIS